MEGYLVVNDNFCCGASLLLSESSILTNLTPSILSQYSFLSLNHQLREGGGGEVEGGGGEEGERGGLYYEGIQGDAGLSKPTWLTCESSSVDLNVSQTTLPSFMTADFYRDLNVTPAYVGAYTYHDLSNVTWSWQTREEILQ